MMGHDAGLQFHAIVIYMACVMFGDIFDKKFDAIFADTSYSTFVLEEHNINYKN